MSSTAPDLASYDIILVNTSPGRDSQAALRVVAETARAAGVCERVLAVHCDLGRRVGGHQGPRGRAGRPLPFPRRRLPPRPWRPPGRGPEHQRKRPGMTSPLADPLGQTTTFDAFPPLTAVESWASVMGIHRTPRDPEPGQPSARVDRRLSPVGRLRSPTVSGMSPEWARRP